MSHGRFLGRRRFVRSTIARWQEATDPQSPKGGSQRAYPAASGRLKTVVLFRQSYPALTNGGVDNAVVPCGTGALVTQSTLRTLRQISATWARDFHFERLGGRSPRWRRTVGRRAPRVRDDSGRSPRSRKTVARRARNAARSSNRQELRIECWKVKFRHFRNELFWQELDIVLVGLGLQQNSSINQAAPAPGP